MLCPKCNTKMNSSSYPYNYNCPRCQVIISASKQNYIMDIKDIISDNIERGIY